MSGLLVLLDDAGRLDSASGPRLLDSTDCGSDTPEVWSDGSVLLACRPDAASVSASCPPHLFVDPDVGVAFDGRLDNRQAIDASLPGRCDAELVASAYRRWGPSCPAHLLGDFAFVIWDRRARRLVAARDVLGLRPLYVLRAGGRAVALASTIPPLVNHPEGSREPNPGFIAECLAGQIVHRTETVWRHVWRVAPSHAIVQDADGSTERRYWAPDPSRTVQYGTDDEYGEELARLLTEAVSTRLADGGRSGVMLSGGIDSSSVVGAWHQTAGDSGLRRTYSLAQPGEPWDESGYLDAVTRRWALASTRVRPFIPSAEYFRGMTADALDLPPSPNGAMSESLFSAARTDRVSVLLTGLWSDEWFSGSFDHYADLVRGRQWRELWRHYRDQPDHPDAYRPPSLFRAAVWPLVPRRAREVIKKALGRDGVPDWIGSSLRGGDVGLAERLRPRDPDMTFPTLAQTAIFKAATGGPMLYATETHQRTAARAGIVVRHPFADRRIMEFGLAIPSVQRWRGRLTKFVLRSAGRDWLPRAVLERVTSAAATNVVVDAIRRELESPSWRDPLIARLGWIDRRRFDETVAALNLRYNRGDDGYHGLAHPVWMACAVEMWARTCLNGETT